jgi:hypothetical protein
MDDARTPGWLTDVIGFFCNLLSMFADAMCGLKAGKMQTLFADMIGGLKAGKDADAMR